MRTATETALDLWTELLVTPLQWVHETAVSLRRGWNLNQLYGVHSLAVVRGCDQDWPHSPLVTLATINKTDIWQLYTTYTFFYFLHFFFWIIQDYVKELLDFFTIRYLSYLTWKQWFHYSMIQWVWIYLSWWFIIDINVNIASIAIITNIPRYNMLLQQLSTNKYQTCTSLS